MKYVKMILKINKQRVKKKRRKRNKLSWKLMLRKFLNR